MSKISFYYQLSFRVPFIKDFSVRFIFRLWDIYESSLETYLCCFDRYLHFLRAVPAFTMVNGKAVLTTLRIIWRLIFLVFRVMLWLLKNGVILVNVLLVNAIRIVTSSLPFAICCYQGIKTFKLVDLFYGLITLLEMLQVGGEEFLETKFDSVLVCLHRVTHFCLAHIWNHIQHLFWCTVSSTYLCLGWSFPCKYTLCLTPLRMGLKSLHSLLIRMAASCSQYRFMFICLFRIDQDTQEFMMELRFLLLSL